MTDSTSQRPHRELIVAPRPGEESQDTFIFPGSPAGNEERLVITNIRATHIDLGLRRIPAGFYVMVQHGGLDWRTENKPILMNSDVEWDDLVPIPSDPTALVSFAVQASFEFEPMLGTGERLRELTITVERLLDHGSKDLRVCDRCKFGSETHATTAFTFSPIDGDVVSPCSSLLVSVKKQDISLASKVLQPHRSVTDPEDELGKATDQGHSALSRFRKYSERQDFDCAMKHFKHAFEMCPEDHSCLAAAVSNLATAMLIHYRVYGNDAFLDSAVMLYFRALAARPVGHPDRSFTLLHLAVVHLAQFEKGRNKRDIADAEALLDEVMNRRLAEDYEDRMSREIRMDRSSPISKERDTTSSSGDADPLISCVMLLRLFARSGNLLALEQAISGLRESMKSIPSGDRGRRYILNQRILGTALQHRFGRLGELNDLEEAISRQRDLVELTPHDDSDRASRLSNLGYCLFARSQRLGESSDLEEAISRQREAAELTPQEHPDKSARLSTLGNSFYARFQRSGELGDLGEAISWQRDAVELIPHDHPDMPTSLSNLGASLLARFERLGESANLEEGISRQRDAVNSAPRDHPDKRRFLNNLGTSLATRFTRFGELGDLEEAISRQRDSESLIPDNHPDKPASLCNLGASLLARFIRLGELYDSDEAVSRRQAAADLIPHDHPEKPGFLNDLGNSLLVRFNRLGMLSDLEGAISSQRNAINLTPYDHPAKPSRLNGLSCSLHTRFERLGELNDLQEAISRQLDAVALTADDHPEKARHLTNLGNYLVARFERLGKSSDLDEAISRQCEAIDLTAHDNPDKLVSLKSLGSSFHMRFQHLGELSDLDKAISIQQDVVDLTPRDHANQAENMDSLGNSLVARFQHLGKLDDLQEAISRQRQAVDLTPRDDPSKPRRLTNLGTALLVRSKRLGQLVDLEEAITWQRDAVNLTPSDDSHKSVRLTSLGNSLLDRFEQLGELSDLEEATSCQQDAVDTTSKDQPNKPMILTNFGLCLLARFQRLGEVPDLERTISTLRHAVVLIPHSHPDGPRYLSHLGVCLRIRFQRLGEIHDSEESILKLQDAIESLPHGYVNKHMYLGNLGNSFLARFRCLGEPGDLEDAISRLREAVKLIPRGHPEMLSALHNLNVLLRARFKHLGELNDLEDAISMQQHCVNLTPHDHPNKPRYLSSLGHLFVDRFLQVKELDNLKQALLSFSHAACARAGSVATRVHASRKWIDCARILRHHSLLHAYSVAIGLLPQFAWIGLSLAHRYRELAQGADVAREAAAAALESGHPETAVEWLEQGRSIVWGELFQLRSSYEELSPAHPEHARRLQELSVALEQASVTRENSLTSANEVDNHRRLAIARDALLQEIRKLPGFDRFLLHKEFSSIRASAHSGPVVILNAAEARSDALIVLADVDRVIHVPLPNFALQRSRDIQVSLRTLVRHARGSVLPCDDNDRYGRPAPQVDAGLWQPMLASLWKCVVKPVLDALAFSTPGELSRIFWCPTGPFMFLPIHAAGLYGLSHSQPGHKVFDFVVSSYIPTLSTLASPPKLDTTASSDIRLLSVPQPPSDGQVKLPGVVDELKQIEAIITDSRSSRISLVEASLGTVKEVLGLMKETDWVHFACHGVQDNEHPIESGLCLADQRRLRVSDMVGLSRPRGGLAFLSACQTAKGDEDLSDEAIHIAAGMLFAGYGGVVGTMWSINDRVAPNVAKDVYEQLFRRGCTPDYREAARALHVAVGRLRERGASFHDWIPFIHVGL